MTFSAECHTFLQKCQKSCTGRHKYRPICTAASSQKRLTNQISSILNLDARQLVLQEQEQLLVQLELLQELER